MEEVFSGFSDSILILVFGVMVVGIAMMDTGVAEFIGKWVTKASAHNERLFMLIAGVTAGLLSTFLSNTAVIAIFLPIIDSVAKTDKKMNRLNLTLPVSMGAMFGGVCTLVGSTPQLTANGILDKMMGTQIGMFEYTLPGVIVFVLYLIYIETIGYHFGNKIWGNRIVDTAKETEKQEEQPQKTYNKKSMVFMISIFVFMIVMFIGGWLDTEVTATIAAILCIITKCTSVKKVFQKMDWSVLFILAGCLGIGAGIKNSGVGELIGSAMSGFVESGIPVVAVFAIFIVVTMVISNFITNSTAVIIVLPVALSLCLTQGFNPQPFTLGIVFAANLTFATPLANAQTAMTLVAGYKFSDYFKYNILLELLVAASIIIFVPMIYPLVG